MRLRRRTSRPASAFSYRNAKLRIRFAQRLMQSQKMTLMLYLISFSPTDWMSLITALVAQ